MLNRDLSTVPPAVLKKYDRMIAKTAYRLATAGKVPYNLDTDDVRSYGRVAVCEAYLTWPGETIAGCKEETFYARRIYCGIIDMFRSEGNAGRKVHGITEDQWQARLKTCVPLSIDVPVADPRLDAELKLATPEDTSVEDDECIEHMLRGIKGIDRYILLWRFENDGMKAIGRRLNLSEARISQRLALLCDRLAKRYHAEHRKDLIVKAINGNRPPKRSYKPRPKRVPTPHTEDTIKLLREASK
jgi:DNA-directed RNA polymerase specialized sigma subunit